MSNEQLAISNEQLAISNEQLAGRKQEAVSGNYRGKVVVGFMAIKGLSVKGAQAVIEERERGGEYQSLDDFSHRVKLNRDDIIALVPAGVFDSIAEGLPRELQARRLLSMKNEDIKMRSEKLGMMNGELFENADISSKTIFHSSLLTSHSSLVTSYSPLPTPNSLINEYKSLGFLRDLHPLALWKEKILAVKNRIKAIHIADYIGRNVKLIGWPVTQKDVWTKDGETMCFLSLEDETAMYETVVFPQIYDRYNRLLFDQKPLLVYGRVEDDLGAVSLEITMIEPVSR